MQTYEYGTNASNHVNAFVDLNGIPYLLSEYLDLYEFQQVDRSLIKSEIIVDQSESMRAVIDISIDDIGKRASDGYPAITGNTTKTNNLLKMLSDNCEIMNHQLSVLRRGIVIRVDYQLENYKTGQVIRSMTESFRIADRSYFLDVNPRDTADNGIIVNFCNTLVSTVNEFTHGQDPMMIRITNIHLSYEMVKVAPHMPRITQSLMNKTNMCGSLLPTQYDMDNDIYRYHTMMQNRHLLPGWNPGDPLPTNPYGGRTNSFSMFNRFYQFDNDGADIVLNDQEINNPMTKVALIPCGIVRVNRTFMINPGHRLIFKFSIWKNDVTVVTDTTNVAQALRAPIMPGYPLPPCPPPPKPPQYGSGCNHPGHYPPPPPPDHTIYPDYETMIRMLDESRKMEYQQNQVINQLTTKMEELTELVQSLVKTPDTPDPDPTPDPTPDPGTGDGDDADEIHDKLQGQITDLEEDVNNIQDSLDDIPNVLPINDDTITTIVKENSDLSSEP